MTEQYGVRIPIESLPKPRGMDPARVVLDEYTDQWIDERTSGRTDPWARAWCALRSVPADWRQSVWASAHARTYRLAVDYAPGWRTEPLRYHTPRHVDSDLNVAIIERVADFHAGWRPERLERLVGDDDPGLWRDFARDPSRFLTQLEQ